VVVVAPTAVSKISENSEKMDAVEVYDSWGNKVAGRCDELNNSLESTASVWFSHHA